MSDTAAVPWLEPAVAVLRQQSKKVLALIAVWALFALWMVVGFLHALAALVVARNTYLALDALSNLLLDFWGGVATAGLAAVAVNPFHWLNGKRLIFACMALATMWGVVGFAILHHLALAVLDFVLAGSVYDAGLSGGVVFVAAIGGFVLMPVALLISGAFSIASIFGFAGLVFGFIIGPPVVLFNQIFQFERAVTIYRYQERSLAGYIVRAVFWLRNEPLPEAAPDDSKGARFATPPEIQSLYQDTPQSMGFGHIGAPLLLKTDKHVLIMASTRSGKGVTLIIPHLLRYRGSAFVLDPKGENAKATGRQRATLNQKVHYLDPFGISGKPQSRFNPLARFTPENMEAESKALAAALFLVSGGERDHWNASGQQLLAAIILYVYVSPDFPPHIKDLPMVRKVLLGGIKGALDAMMLIDDADGLLRDLATSFIKTPEKEFGSIVSTAQRQTEILDNPFMIACLKASGDGEEVDFKQWHSGTMTVYLCLSAPKFPTFNRWLRLVLTSALDEMTDSLDPPKLPVCFMLDELATLGHLATVENAVGLAAGYGIQLVTVFQDVAQMRDLYKGRWASFIGNAGVRALFNLDDYDTAKYWSDFIGGNLVETRSSAQDIYGFKKGDNVSEAMRPLIPPDKIMMDFASGKMLVLTTGAHPFTTDRVAYFDDKSLNGLWDDPRVKVTRKPAPKYPTPPPSTSPPASDKKSPPTSAPQAAAPQQARQAPPPSPPPARDPLPPSKSALRESAKTAEARPTRDPRPEQPTAPPGRPAMAAREIDELLNRLNESETPPASSKTGAPPSPRTVDMWPTKPGATNITARMQYGVGPDTQKAKDDDRER